MSASYPPSGGRPPLSCQRCGMSLPPNEMRCGNCGFSNVPGPGGNVPGGSSPQMPMSGPPSQSGFNLRQQFGSGTWGSQPGPQMGRPANAPTASGLFTPPSIPQPIHLVLFPSHPVPFLSCLVPSRLDQPPRQIWMVGHFQSRLVCQQPTDLRRPLPPLQL